MKGNWILNKYYNILDEMPEVPVGWCIAFGDMMVEEIDQQLKKEGEDVRNNYQVFQAKEKYGELRWYDNGSEEVHKIRDKYSIISHNVCVCCGKPDVPVHEKGWIYPICEECYYNENEYDKLPYHEVVDEDDSVISDKYTVRIYTKEKGFEDIVYDISDTVKKVRENYLKRINEELKNETD